MSAQNDNVGNVSRSNACCPPQKVSGVAPKPSSCCPPKLSPKPSKENSTTAFEVSHEDVSEYYGKTLQTQDDLLTSACLTQGEETREVRRLVRNIHPEVLDKFYGCGSPIPPLLKERTVLDLGCGTGRDVYTASQLVGEHGRVIGIDMTEEQLAVARKHEEWHREKFGFKESNVEFKKAFIEDLHSAGIQDSSVDVVISNCVINLAPNKEPVLREIERVLKLGGELYFSDVFSDRRIPSHLKNDKVLFGECLGGALYLEDFRRLMTKVGLSAWGITTKRQILVNSEKIRAQVGDIQFFSVTVRAIKVPMEDAEDSPEDYGQVAVYRGNIPGQLERFSLDTWRNFFAGVEAEVDSTTAAMLKNSRYASAFDVTKKGQHRGPFTLWHGRLGSQTGGKNVLSLTAEEKAAGPVKCC